ncbi:MAG: class II fumarate hydratase [Thermomonas sp.]|uniref:class II fumarate hydratase n=1 Tax=Thermomonas sp. TaxID=1971895 RepID=UPI0026208EBE|nr:class II fumarate hydratase [Thermomonas sp.]MCC7097863.1 class II fumarate hydratase [Thermomonas sp.]
MAKASKTAASAKARKGFRLEHDSMGDLQVPASALWGAQTQRAVENFHISGRPMPAAFIRAHARLKAAAAEVNHGLGVLDGARSSAIIDAANAIAEGKHADQFPIDRYQTGSGTSTNMNVNEVIAHLASKAGKAAVHPNDHVNLGQSSNDTIPSSLRVMAVVETRDALLPALAHLRHTIDQQAKAIGGTVKTGRTHLMDAMPLTFAQEFGAWSAQLESAQGRIEDSLKRVRRLPIGGTAIGTGINAHPKFGKGVAKALSGMTDSKFEQASNLFEGLAAHDDLVELSGQFSALAVALMKIGNDLRWMNSGPLAGLGEIELKALQPGSSIMPGKVNPVIPEALCMVCAQVMGLHQANTVAGQSGNFQLNVMLPLLACNLDEAIGLLAQSMRELADNAIATLKIRKDKVAEALDRNPILVTALNPVIGYEKAAKIAKRAYAEGRPVLDVALEDSGLTEKQLRKLLDPAALTKGGIGHGGGGGG